MITTKMFAMLLMAAPSPTKTAVIMVGLQDISDACQPTLIDIHGKSASQCAPIDPRLLVLTNPTIKANPAGYYLSFDLDMGGLATMQAFSSQDGKPVFVRFATKKYVLADAIIQQQLDAPQLDFFFKERDQACKVAKHLFKRDVESCNSTTP
jgi:hypothetical protein